MSHPSKAKGYRFEKALVDQAQKAGCEASRAWGSNGQSLGHHPEVDILVGGFKGQAKSRKKLSALVRPSQHVDFQVIKEDRGEAFVVIPYITFLDLIRSHNETLRAASTVG